MDGWSWNTSFLLGWPIFKGHVRFRECNIPSAEERLDSYWPYAAVVLRRTTISDKLRRWQQATFRCCWVGYGAHLVIWIVISYVSQVGFMYLDCRILSINSMRGHELWIHDFERVLVPAMQLWNTHEIKGGVDQNHDPRLNRVWPRVWACNNIAVYSLACPK